MTHRTGLVSSGIHFPDIFPSSLFYCWSFSSRVDLNAGRRASDCRQGCGWAIALLGPPSDVIRPPPKVSPGTPAHTASHRGPGKDSEELVAAGEERP